MPVTQDDPMSDEAPAVVPPGGCVRCDGHGMIQVKPAYGERKFPGDLAALALAVAEVDARIQAHAEHDAPADPVELRIHHEAREALLAERAVAYAAWDDLDSKRRHAEQDVYPCPACNEPLFLRWSSGCLDRDHRATTCERCLAILGKTDAARHDRHAFPGQAIK